MPKQKVQVTQSFSAPVEAVFAALSDHNKLGPVLGVPVRRIKDGNDDPNGVGSIRTIGPGPIGTQETVVGFVPNERVDYVITKFGGPVRNHNGELRFKSTDNGSEVTWNIHFDTFPSVIGGGVKSVLELALKAGLGRLARQL